MSSSKPTRPASTWSRNSPCSFSSAAISSSVARRVASHAEWIYEEGARLEERLQVVPVQRQDIGDQTVKGLGAQAGHEWRPVLGVRS